MLCRHKTRTSCVCTYLYIRMYMPIYMYGFFRTKVCKRDNNSLLMFPPHSHFTPISPTQPHPHSIMRPILGRRRENFPVFLEDMPMPGHRCHYDNNKSTTYSDGYFTLLILFYCLINKQSIRCYTAVQSIVSHTRIKSPILMQVEKRKTIKLTDALSDDILFLFLIRFFFRSQ